MAEPTGRNAIRLMRKKWLMTNFFSNCLYSIALASIVSTILYKLPQSTVYLGMLIFPVCFLVLSFLHLSRKIDENEVSRLLNRLFPEMEESAGLLLRNYESLNRLEKMQADKLEKAISVIPTPPVWKKRLRTSWIVLGITIMTCVILYLLPFAFYQGSLRVKARDSTNNNIRKAEKLPPAIASVSVKIVPPAYTGRSIRRQNQFNLLVEENAEVIWELSTTSYVDHLNFIFNDSISLSLKPLNETHTLFSVRKAVKATGFYQVRADKKLSELYKIETIRDQPPVIRIQSPKPFVIIDFGKPQKVVLNVALADDYGVASAGIVATISSGSGEAVKFKEQQLSFAQFNRGRQSYQLSRLIDLPALGLQAGDELYYYVIAKDNQGQESRSEINIINIADTAKLMSMEGMTGGINLVPEYFRSQRQIIIETEQLLREKDTIALQQFNNRSNNLGLDQKLLRLRYGKFLGEVSENEIGSHENHDGHEEEGHPDKAAIEPREFGNAAAIIDAYTHKHDNAEDATFFEPELKAQLKATLDEMWKSELQLRTYKPDQALPFEYKALRLLKDLQQKSRAYVAKTGVRTTPLKPESRLTGDLEKILQPVTTYTIEKNNESGNDLKLAITVLESLKQDRLLKNEEIEILKKASRQLNLAGSSKPAIYLLPVQAMRRILELINHPGQIQFSDIASVEHAIQMLLPASSNLPASNKSLPASDLSRQYFKNLNRISP